MKPTDLESLVSMTWVAAQQTSTKTFTVDEETHAFFMDQSASIPAKTLVSATEKLLPSTFTPVPSDLSSTRQKVASNLKTMDLSASALYKDPEHPTRVAIIAADMSLQTPNTTFIMSIAKAITERLHKKVLAYSYNDASFTTTLPLLTVDCDIILCFIEHHQQASWEALLQTIPHYLASENPVDPPFCIFGSINNKPLRTLLLTNTTAEDKEIKQQLWNRLKHLLA